MRSLYGLRALAADQGGATILEFALIAPALVLCLLGGMDIAHTLYTTAQLQGVVQKTGRDFTLENSASSQAQRDALDEAVRRQASALVNDATIDISRRYWRTFSTAAAATAEIWTDTNTNGRCDAGEPYEDQNANSVWDADGGDSGLGGAKDTVVYTVTMRYTRMFPLTKLLGVGNATTVRATTVLRNQPYGEQGNHGTPVSRNCP